MRSRIIGGILFGMALTLTVSTFIFFFNANSKNQMVEYQSGNFVMASETSGYSSFPTSNQSPPIQTITLMRPQQTKQAAKSNNARNANPVFAPSPPVAAPRFANSNSQSFGSAPPQQLASQPANGNLSNPHHNPFQNQTLRSNQPQLAQSSPNQFGKNPGVQQSNSNQQLNSRPPSQNNFGSQNRFGGSRSGPTNPNQRGNFNGANSVNSGFNSATNASPAPTFPTIYEQVVKGLPQSANNVKAIVRAKYSISETDGQKLSEVLAQADSLVETSMGEDEITMTCSQEVHMAVSRFISTFLTKEGSPSNLSGPERVDNVRLHNNIQRQVTQASYESAFEPSSLGFAPSAEDVKVLLRADYELPADKAKLFENLLKTKSRLLLEATLVSPDELTSSKTATLTVTTTRAGQLAVAHLIEALFATDAEKDVDAKKDNATKNKVSTKAFEKANKEEYSKPEASTSPKPKLNSDN